MDWDVVAACGQVIGAVAAIGAVVYAGEQLRQARRAAAEQAADAEEMRATEERARRVERAIAAHRDLTTLEVGAARDRLSTLLWQKGEETYGRNVCWRARLVR